jgi:hypothetical protein
MANYSNWILNIGDGVHFDNSAPLHIWGCKSITKKGTKSTSAKFINTAQEGDKLWFIKSKTRGRVYAVATFIRTMKRETGPLIALTHTSEELGWTNEGDTWDTEIHYKDLYKISKCEIYLKSRCPQCVISPTEQNDKYGIDWVDEHSKIVRYSKAKRIRPRVVLYNPFMATLSEH